MTPRAILLAMLLIPINAYWLVIIELVRNTQTPTSVSLFFNVIFTIIVLMGINTLVRRTVPRWALRAEELVVIYILLSVGSAMAGIDTTLCLTPVMAYPHRYAAPENNWEELVLPHLSTALVVNDPDALTGYWAGGSRLYEPANLRAWLMPMFRWHILIALLCLSFLALTTLFRRRWIDTERLTYPIIQTPFAITTQPRTLLGAKAFWVALCLVCAIDLLNGLHVLKPIVPQIPVRSTALPGFNLGAQLVDRPWNAVGFFAVSFYPFIIGMGLLIPAELTLSCWVFYLLFKAQLIGAAHLGKLEANAFPFVKEQSLGAYAGLVLFSLWMSRSHFARLAQAVRKGGRSDPDEAMSYRTAVALLVVCLAGIIGFGVWAGMSWWYAVGFFVVYYTLTQSVTRIRAEMGIPSHELYFVGPGQILPRLLGSEVVGPRNLGASYLFYWFNYAYRSHPMPHIAEGHKLLSRLNIPARRLTMPMLAAMLLGSVAAGWAALHLYYIDGAAAKWGPGYASVWVASQPLNEMVAKLSLPTGPNAGVAVALAMGLVGALVGMALRASPLKWPLHPVGYAVSTAWAMDHMWFSLFIAWAIKALIIRYGGSVGYRRAVPIAMGLILGDFLSGSLWSIYGVLKGIRAYSIWV